MRFNGKIFALRLLSCAALCLLASCATRIAYIPPVGPGYRLPQDFKVVGYFPSWSGHPEELDYRALTHICWAFVDPTMEGGYKEIAQEAKLRDLVARAHAQGVKVLASLGGWNDGKPNAYDTIAADPKLKADFVQATLDLMARYDLDGADMDWEFPKAETAENFAGLMAALAEGLHGAGKLLSAAVPADGPNAPNYLDSVIADVDFLNVMAYDDGFGKDPGLHHSTYAFARASLDYWLQARGAPREKVILGVPFYGRSLADRHSISYYNIRKADPRASASDRSGGFGYNGFDTLRAKAVNQARARAGGVMVWQLYQDANGADSLLNALFDVLKEPAE